MKVLHVAPSRNSESSAAWRILAAQRNLGVDAEAFVHKKFQTENTLRIIPTFPINHKNSVIVNSALRRITQSGFGSPWSYNYVSPDFSNQLQEMEFDLINLHWLPSTVSLNSIAKIRKPIVLTLHDVWNLTGGCHCNLECDSWKFDCGNCPQQPKHLPKMLKAEATFNLKKMAFEAASNLTIVAPSVWIGKMAEQSPLFEKRQIRVISNAIDPERFKPLDNVRAKTKLRIDLNLKVVLLVVSGDVTAYHKGYDLLKEIIDEVALLKSEKDLIRYLVVGDSTKISSKIQNENIVFLGQIHSEKEMIQIYSASDVVISTSRQDNLPNVLLEAMMCGKPVISFKIGGIPEIVRPGITGELITPFNPRSFALAILDVIRNNKKFKSSEIRGIAIQHFSSRVVGKKYLDLYEELVDETL